MSGAEQDVDGRAGLRAPGGAAADAGAGRNPTPV